MNWTDERYVRVYTRDTPDWLALSWDAQALFMQLLRKVDRAGVLDLGRHGQRGVALVLNRPNDWERLETALVELVADGCVSVNGDKLVIRNFVEAQEARQSDRTRQAEHRAKRREQAYKMSQPVTRSHTESHDVTACHSVPSCTVPSRTNTVGEADRDLFGNSATAPAPAEPSAHSVLKGLFLAWYLERYGEEYKWSGKESGHVTSALKLAGGLPEAVMEKVRAADQPWRKSRVSLGVVVSAWNEIKVEDGGEDKFVASLKRIKGAGQ